jgi:hypothetical protein
MPGTSGPPLPTTYEQLMAMDERSRPSEFLYPELYKIPPVIPEVSAAAPPPPEPDPFALIQLEPEQETQFLSDATDISTSFGVPFEQAIRSLAEIRGVDPSRIFTQFGIGTAQGLLNPAGSSTQNTFGTVENNESFLSNAQSLSTSAGIPLQQAIISLAASRGLDPNQFLNVPPVGIGSIAPA